MASRILLLCLGFYLGPLYADVVEFPEEEIATETVLPVFDRVEAVKNRNIVLRNHFEVGIGGGLSLNEAFYNPLTFNVDLTYHLTEVHAVNLVGLFRMDGLNGYGTDLRSGKGLTGDSFDASLAPHPKYMLLGNYQFTAYYGKISITKSEVMNLTLFGDAGLGYIGMNGLNSIALSAGVGQNFYFTKRLSLRLDLRLLMYKAPDPTSLGPNSLQTGSVAPSPGSFSQILTFGTLLTGSVAYLL
jgi:outer membrane beta-barrel protein